MPNLLDPQVRVQAVQVGGAMQYKPMDFSSLIGMDGFSDSLLKTHFGLYAGYVNNTNRLMETLASMTRSGNSGTPEYAELKRRFGWEFNGMRLHELYFSGLGGDGTHDPRSRLSNEIAASFGSREAWEADFRAAAKMRGIGWVVLYQDLRTGALFNAWVNEHDTGHLAGCVPVLIIDVFEHAYMADYGTDRQSYIDSFFRNVSWKSAEKRATGQIQKSQGGAE
jgi:Fe-Mn family superoxide dismutase